MIETQNIPADEPATGIRLNLRRYLWSHLWWKCIALGSGFLLHLLIARKFGSIDSGAFFYLINVLSLLLLFGGLSLESGVTYYLSTGSLPAPPLVRFLVPWSVVAAFVTALGSLWYFSHREAFFVPRIGILSFTYILAGLWVAYGTGIAHGKNQFMLPGLLASIFHLLCIMVLLFGPESMVGANSFLLIYVGLFFLQGLVLQYLPLRVAGPGSRAWLPRTDQLSQLFRYSITALVANLLFYLVYRIDYFFVDLYSSGADLGNYIQASKFGQLLVILPSMTATVLFPMLAGRGTGAADITLRMSRILLLGTFLAALLLIVTGPGLFRLLLGPGYDNVYPAFLWLVPGLLALSFLYPLVAFFSAQDRIRDNTKSLLWALLVIVVADLLLIPRWGIRGAALASSLGYLTYHISLVRRFTLYTTIPWRSCYRYSWPDIRLAVDWFTKPFSR